MQKVMHNFVNGTKTRRFSIAKNKYIRLTGLTASILFIALGLTSIFPVIKNTDKAEAFNPYPDNVELNMVVGREIAHLDIVPGDADGTFASSSSAEVASFDVSTNNYTGYTLTISGNDDDGELSNTNSGTALNSITSPTSADTFANGAPSTYTNKWGYQASKYNSSTSSYDPLFSGNFLPAPTTTSTTIDTTSTANPTANNYNIALGARVDYQKPSGTYTNTYNLAVVANYVAYAITYTDPTGEATSMPTNSQSGSTAVANITLAPNSTPSRNNYVFRSWCNGTVNSDATICTGTEYQAGEAMPLDATTSNDIALKALWTVYIQDLTASQCSAMASSADYKTYDKRDGKDYTVRYINGHCWMTSNLRFTGISTDSAGTMTLNSTTSNVSANYTPSNPLILTYVGPNASGDAFTELRVQDGVDNKNNPTTWYNFAAVSAGSLVGNPNTTPESSYSICPAGWKIPTDSELSGIVSYKAIFNSVAGGVYNINGEKQENNNGYWWGSTIGNTSSSTTRKVVYYRGSDDSFNIYTDGSWRANMEYTRCIRISSVSDVVSMQQFGSLTGTAKTEVRNNMSLNTAYSLPDIRDSINYNIKKLGSNNDVWMTSNLLTQKTSFDKTNSDVTTTRTLNGGTYSGYSLVGTDATGTSSNCYGDYTGSAPATSPGKGYINACMYYTASDSNIGNKPNAWYNFAAATAGTIKVMPSSSGASATPTESICPAGWTIPSEPQASTLDGNTNFSGVKGGNYLSGHLQYTDTGYYWTATAPPDAPSVSNRYYYTSASGGTAGHTSDGGGYRARGFYLRCVAR